MTVEDLTAAEAAPLVLTILSEGESYGFAILVRARELSEGGLEWTDGMFYPLFHRLRRLGYLTTEGRSQPEGRLRTYYSITRDGRTALAKRRRSAPDVVGATFLGTQWLLTAPGAAA